MKHHIMAKFKKDIILDDIFDDVKSIFEDLIEIDGIHEISYKKNCIKRDGRFDLLIIIDMDKEALPIYDDSKPHMYWKEKYGSMLEAKAIFDSEK